MGVMRLKNQRGRLMRKFRIRNKISGTSNRPRLCVSRSNLRLYLQVIDDISGNTLVSASSLEKDFYLLRPNIEGAEKLGEVLGERLKKLNITRVVFDRSGYKYHGVVKNIADAVRRCGVEF